MIYAIAYILIGMIAFALALFWFLQLIDLMSRKDSDFPGKYDKPCWLAILLVTNWVGALAYIILKPFKISSTEQSQTLENVKSRNLEKMPNAPKKCPNCGTSTFYNANSCLSCGWSYEGTSESESKET